MKVEIGNATLYHGDCLEVMKQIPDGSIDMVLADQPYGTTANKWDVIIPLMPMWKELNRVIKKNGAIILTGQGLFTAQLQITSSYFRYSLVWEKTRAGGFLNARRMPLQCHEDITVHYKETPCYNPQMDKGEAYIRKSRTNGDGRSYGKFERQGTTLVNEGDRFPRSVIKIANSNSNSLHPTQKPVALMEYLILTYTNGSDTVLDFTMGSGTTGVACKNLNRNFIGIELDEGYFKIAGKRIVETATQMQFVGVV